jgi:hypothetical protein
MTLHSCHFSIKLKNHLMKRILLLILLSLLTGIPAAAKTEDKSSNAKLRLPWEVLREVLKLDSKNVRLTWEEYHTLLRLTSPKKIPEFTMAGGDVVLSREEFTRLVQSLLPPSAPASAATVVKASYHGRLTGTSAIFTAFLRVEVTRRPVKPIRFDLFPGSVAFQDIKLDGKPALAEIENGRLFLTLDEAGSHKVELHFSVPVPESTATQSLSIPIARTPITEWILDIPERNLDISVTSALHREISSVEKGTRVRTLLSPSDNVTATWNPLAPDTAKGPAQIYADVDHLISILDDSLRIKSRVGIDVLQNTINTLTLDLPDGFSVLDVQGDAVKEWQETPGKPAALLIPLRTARKGRMDFVVALERVLASEKSTTKFTGLTVRGAVRQRGYIGVELNSDAELPAPVTQNLEPKDPFREMPSTLAGQSARLLFGYKYVHPPFALNLALSRHESVNVVPSVIDRAEGTTVIRPDGKNVHRITYFLRSSAKQFLEVVLPENTQLWSAFVDGAPVKPVRGEGQKTLIPLVRSLRADNAAFPVELVYYQERQRLSLFGREDLPLPMPDVLVSRLRWSVVTPPEQNFFYLGNEFEKPEPLFLENRPFVTLAANPSGGMALDRSTKKSADMARQEMDAASDQKMETVAQMDGEEMADDEDMGGRVDRLKEKSNMAASPGAPPAFAMSKIAGGVGDNGFPSSMTAGILPVRVTVPAIGNTVTYTKTLPEPNTLLTLPLYHVAVWIRTLGWFIAFAVLALMGWTFRGSLRLKRFEGAKS